MNQPTSTHDDELLRELHELASASLRDELTPEMATRLEYLVLENDRARELYVGYMQDTVTLEFWASRASGTEAAEVTPADVIEDEPAGNESEAPLFVTPADSGSALPNIRTGAVGTRYRRRSPLRRFVTATVIAAGLATAVIVGLGKWNQGGNSVRPGVAVLKSSASGVWEDKQLRPGDAIAPRKLRLASGFAELQMNGGATVVVEGPAVIEPLSDHELKLHSGQLVAHVPAHAVGFTVSTADGRLVDLGTEFGARVREGQATELHVFTGRVEGVLGSGESAVRQAVAAGAAARLSRGATALQPIPLDQSGFARFMPVPGLYGEYFNERNLTDLADTRIDREINFADASWDLAPAGTQVTPDSIYSDRWTGYVRIEQSGRWTVYTTSNDGVRLYLDDELLIDHWDQHTEREHKKTLRLEAGWHAIRLEHFQDEKDVAMVLSFSGPGQPQTVIPPTHLSVVQPVTGERADGK